MLNKTMFNNAMPIRLALLLLTTLFAPLAFAHSQPASAPPTADTTTTTITYTPTNALFPNPERGIYRHTEAHATNYLPLNLASLQNDRQNQNITLILRMFYLQAFVQSDISPTYLAQMQTDFDTLRTAGLKVIIRFAYTKNLPPEPPYGDASPTQILRHLEQLQPILQANADVIAAVQAGFIGVWGEWYYTDHFVDDPTRPWIISPAQHAQRRDVVVETLLDILPETHFVQLRYPASKQIMFGDTTPLEPTEAFSGRALARLAHHNDCFLASDNDLGTYRGDQIEADKAYVAAETRFLPQGGESCRPNPPRTLCPTALAELATFHWSFLNLLYHPDVLTGWADGGCWEEIQRRLGYRLALTQGVYTDQVVPGQPFTIALDLHNEGWAAPFNPRQVALVLRHTTDQTIYHTSLPTDPRFWLPEEGPITLDYHICTAASLPPGDYELLLHLPDPHHPQSAAYAIRLANEGVWEEATGYNHLGHTLTVLGDGATSTHTTAAMLTVCQIENVYLPLITSP